MVLAWHKEGLGAQPLSMSLPDIQTVQYFPTCSDVGLSDYKASEAIEFDPSSAKYFEVS